MTAHSPETQQTIAVLRQKISEGIASMDDMKLAVKLVRGDRSHAQVASDGARRKKAVAAIPTADDMLSELDGL